MTEPARMNLLQRIYRGDYFRKSRFHTATGTLCLNPGDMAVAFGSTILRLTTGKLLDLPWITFPALRFLKTLPADMVVFEYGCGMSTRWYSRHFKEVHAVESNPDWFARVKRMTQDRSNVSIVLQENGKSYVEAIEHTAHREFDLVVIDGRWRNGCALHALGRLRQGGYIMLDNSDIEIEARNTIDSHPNIRQKLVFSGFASGIFHVNETIIWQVK